MTPQNFTMFMSLAHSCSDVAMSVKVLKCGNTYKGREILT